MNVILKFSRDHHVQIIGITENEEDAIPILNKKMSRDMKTKGAGILADESMKIFTSCDQRGVALGHDWYVILDLPKNVELENVCLDFFGLHLDKVKFIKFSKEIL